MKHFLELMAGFIAVRQPGRRPNVARDKVLVAFGNDAAGTSPITGGSFGNGIADFHEVFVPTGPFICVF
jgi:hypothetical protein